MIFTVIFDSLHISFVISFPFYLRFHLSSNNIVFFYISYCLDWHSSLSISMAFLLISSYISSSFNSALSSLSLSFFVDFIFSLNYFVFFALPAFSFFSFYIFFLYSFTFIRCLSVHSFFLSFFLFFLSFFLSFSFFLSSAFRSLFLFSFFSFFVIFFSFHKFFFWHFKAALLLILLHVIDFLSSHRICLLVRVNPSSLISFSQSMFATNLAFSFYRQPHPHLSMANPCGVPLKASL
ncbi:unnamed protein product [Acanthosepion pharaonis]|uniref:Uncharacterized protein n=1 Tax=Acanthosepion pharaonis TaxID=158019 RepID=A0A812DGZ5_ACAPH|nr:unnamed protein product [Sepia pharaonis]